MSTSLCCSEMSSPAYFSPLTINNLGASKHFPAQKLEKYKVVHHGTMAKQSRQGQTYKWEKSYYGGRKTIFCVNSLPWLLTEPWTELVTGPVTKRVLARWRYWCSIKYKVGLSGIYITTNKHNILSLSLSLFKETTTPTHLYLKLTFCQNRRR